VFYSNEGDYPGADSRTVPMLILWIFVPFVVLILVVAVTRLFVAGPDLQLGGKLIGVAMRGNGEPVLVSSATEFEWERMCVFRPFTAGATVNAQLGHRWGGQLDHDWPTAVFQHAGRVVLHTAVSPRAIETPAVRGTCHGRDDAFVRWQPGR
jgi:hypothetical protein